MDITNLRDSAMQPPEPGAFEFFMQWIWLPVTGAMVWLGAKVVDHGEKIAVLEKTVASTEVIRKIVKDEHKPIEDKLDAIKTEIDQIRSSLGTRIEDTKR